MKNEASELSLVFRVAGRLFALPLGPVVETLRALAVEPLMGAPAFVRGVAVVRGLPAPVVEMGRLFDEARPPGARWITLAIDARRVVLAVDDVLGVRVLAAEACFPLPPLFREARSDIVSAIGLLDGELAAVIGGAFRLPDEVWACLEPAGVARRRAMTTLEQGRIQRFRAAVASLMALQLDANACPARLPSVLENRARACGLGPDAYLGRLETGASDAEIAALAQELTVGETYLFRNIEQFNALREIVAARLLRSGGLPRPLRVLSAGCASGEEAYSIDITLRQVCSVIPFDWSVRAVDVNPVMIDRARRARYSPWSLRETPPEALRRWIRKDGAEIALDDAVRTKVGFELRNLAVDDPQLWARGAYDVVFCRNVLMYFTRRAATALVRRIEQALVPGGLLFLGHAETLRGISEAFAVRHDYGTFWYDRADRTSIATSHAGSSPMAPATWVEEIGLGATRVLALAAGATPPNARRGATREQPVAERAQELYRQEQFSEALAFVHALPSEAASAPDMLLLHGALRAHHGEFARAEHIAGQLLAIDPADASALHLLALCREALGDPHGAVENDRRAVQLDPTFAIASMHLGLMARRTRDFESARDHFERALALLHGEQSARLLLFGGGFSRDALMDVCRGELQSCRDSA